MDPLKRDEEIRRLLGLAEGEEIPPGLIESMTAQASMPKDDYTRELELANISSKMHNLGMTGENNIASNILTRKAMTGGSDLFPPEMMMPEEVLSAPSGTALMMDNWGYRWQKMGGATMRSGLKVAQLKEDIDSIGPAVFFGGIASLQEKFGIDSSEALRLAEKSIKDPANQERIEALKNVEATVGVALEDHAQYLNGLIALNERKMQGKLGVWRTIGRGAGNLGQSLVDFGGAAYIGFLAGGPAGSASALDMMFATHANTHAWDVYDETGDTAQAIFSGVLNFTVTKAIMGRAHGSVLRTRTALSQVIPKLTINQRGQIARHLERGQINPIMEILKSTGRFGTETVLLRETEYLLNVGYQEYLSTGHHASMYKLSLENALAVAGHSLEEAAVLGLMPMITQSAGRGASWVPIRGLSKAKSNAAFKYWQEGMGSVSEMLSRANGKELFEIRGRFIQEVGESPSNPVQKLQLEMIDNALAKKTITVEPKTPRLSKLNEIAKEVEAETNQGKRFSMWDDATQAWENVFGKFEQSNKVTVTVDEAVEPARHRTNEETRQNIEKEETEKLTPTKISEEKTETLGGEREALGKPKELDVEELSLDMLFNDPSGAKAEAYRGEIKELRAKKTLNAEEKQRLSSLEESVETATILRERAGKERVEFGEEGSLRAAQLEEKINRRNAAIKLKSAAEAFVEKVVKPLKARLVGVSEGELTSTWSKFIGDIEAKFGETNPELVAAVKTAVRTNKKDGDGNPIFTDKAKLESAIGRAETRLIKFTEIKEGAESMLGWRTNKPGSRLTPMLDNVITSIKKAVDKTWEKGGDYKKAIENYFTEKGRHFNETEKESLEVAQKYIKLVDKVKDAKGDFSVLDAAEARRLENFIKEVYDASNAGLEIQSARKDAKVNLLDKIMTREIILAKMAEGNKEAFAENPEHFKAFGDLIKALAHGMKENGRLTDYAEYISGGNSTVTYRVLYENVIQGLKDARHAESKLHFMLQDILTMNNITAAELKSIAGNQAKNKRTSKKFEPAATVVHEGKTIRLSSPEVLDIWMQMADSTTAKLWLEKNAGIKVEGLHDSIEGKNQKAIIESIMDQTAGGVEARVAQAYVEFVNSAEVKSLVRDVGLRLKGRDILEQRDPGDNFMFRRREFERVEEIEGIATTKVDAENLFDAMKTSGLGDLLDSTLKTDTLEARSETGKYDIIVGDGTSKLNNWIHALTNLRHLEEHLTLAQNIVTKGREFRAQRKAMAREAGSKKAAKVDRLSAELMEAMNENFYKKIIAAEQGYLGMRNDVINRAARVGRGFIQTAKLGLKLPVIIYQGTSLWNAQVHMGAGGKRAIMQAMFENLISVGRGKNQELHERALRNSGLYWERSLVGSAQALTTGTTAQSAAMFSEALVGGRKVKGTTSGVFEKAERARQGSMKGIQAVDMATVRILYRATEIHLQNRWARQGKKIEGNEELFNNIVRREYENNLVETQPGYHPAFQPANINKGRTELGWAAMTMFRGFTGKLTAIQRRAFMRASREYARGNRRAAMGHITEAMSMTLVTAALIPVIRRLTNVGLAYGTGALISTFFDTESGVTWDDAKESAQKDLWYDIATGGSGMTPLGGVANSVIFNPAFSSAFGTGGYRYEGDFSPLVSTVSDLLSMDPVPNNTKGWLRAGRTLSNVVGMPEEPMSILLRVIKLQEQAAEWDRKRAGTRLFE